MDGFVQSGPAVDVETVIQPARPNVGPRPRDDAAPRLTEVAGGLVAFYSRSAPDGPEPNEDRTGWWTLAERSVALAVADGAGGHAQGGRAAQLALAALGQAVAGASEGGADLRASVLDGFELANRRILELKTGAAAALAVALVEGRTLRTFHAGDAQILVVGQRGKLRLQTMPHSPVGYAVEAGMLDQSDAIHHDERHLVSNLVGSPEMHIEVSAPLRLQVFDTVVVASDGVFDNLQVPEIVNIVRAGPLAAAAAELASWCHQRMADPAAGEPSKVDDATFILYRPGRRTAD